MRTHALPLGLLLALPSLACAQDLTIPSRLSGHFEVTDNTQLEGTAVDVHMVDGLSYHVRLGDRWFRISRPDVDTDTLSGPELDPTTVVSGGITGALSGAEGPGNWATKGSATLTVKVIDVRNYEGEIDEASGSDPKFKLLRRTMIPAADMDAFDRGPRGRIARHLARAPRYPNTGDYKGVFWADWGAVFYRGRLNGTARLLGIASDPGPTEGLPFVRRSLVGDAGQRTQGFLEKLGLTRSYVLVNAFSYPTRPSRIDQGRKLFRDFPEQLLWRNEYYDLLYSSGNIQGIALFGLQATKAFDLWNAYRQAKGHPDLRLEVTVVDVPHPSSGRGEWDSFASRSLARGWRRGISDLRKVVTPDDEALAKQPNYGLSFSEVDYAPIPPLDLPKKAQTYPGIRDNSWSRTKITGRRNNSVRRYGNKSMQLNTLAGEEIWLRVIGQNLLNPNRTPRYRRFKTPTAISVFAVRQRFGANSKYLSRMTDLSKTRYLNVLKLVDSSSRTEAQVIEGLDKLLPDPDAD
ncbi:MAG: hypothetical protein JKY65_34135 [Planctomycetes bacterium]|nr:hypothetical protein [Planctomycetota bacterium]